MIKQHCQVEKLNTIEVFNVPTSWNNLKTKVDDKDVGKLKAVLVDLKYLSDAVDKKVVKNTKFITLKTKVNDKEKKIPDATTLIHINQYNLDQQNLKKKNGDVDRKIPDTSGLVTTNVLNTKISEVENKITDHVKYITTPEFNEVTAENFKERLKKANLVNKTDFDNKLISFTKNITFNKTKYLEVKKKISSLITQIYNFFSGRIYFRSNDGSQNRFVHHT